MLMVNPCAPNIDGLKVQMLDGCQQGLEKRTIKNHHPAQFFCGSAALTVPHDRVRITVVLHYSGMVDREVRCALFEIGQGISALVHDVDDQLLCKADSEPRIIDKATLHSSPFCPIRFLVRGSEKVETEFLDSPNPILQCGFGKAAIAMLLNRPIILRTKAAF